MRYIYKLNECAIIDNSGNVSIKKGNRINGIYPYYGANGIQEYIDSYTYDGNYILIGGDGSTTTENGTPVLHIANGKFSTNNHAHVITNKDMIKFIYLYYALGNTNIEHLLQGGRNKLKRSALDKINIKFPKNINHQQQIINILNTMTNYCNNINDGLEKELQLREKQYKYYLNKLLTF